MMNLLEAATNGTGIYTIAEAARYAKIHPNTLRSWFFPNVSAGRKATMRASEVPDEDLKSISFLDFIEAIAVRSLRVDYGVSFKTIREAITNAEKRGVRHPFARQQHTTYRVGKDLHIILPDDPHLLGLTGPDADQKSFVALMEKYMDAIDYDANGLACAYTAFKHGDQKVVMNPKVYFGEPVIVENGFPASVLWNAAIAEGGYEQAAKRYAVTVDAVAAAYLYCNGELSLAAA